MQVITALFVHDLSEDGYGTRASRKRREQAERTIRDLESRGVIARGDTPEIMLRKILAWQGDSPEVIERKVAKWEQEVRKLSW